MDNYPKYPVSLPGAKADTLMWAHPHEVEAQALNQLRNISKLPWVEKLRVMPDVHLGKGATVGSVIGMRGAVSPNAVGVDIGCGMAATRTNLTTADLPDDLGALRSSIERAVPVGFKAHDRTASVLNQSQLGKKADYLFKGFKDLRAPQIADREGKMLSQCGTLGGGNHFIELCADEQERVWLMLHSGSRNIGKELAERHIARAKTLEHNVGIVDRELSVFLAGTREYTDYVHDLYWAQSYASLNRQTMLALVKRQVQDHFAHAWFDPEISCHHNYVSEETYDGVDLVVTRKGAIRAAVGELGLIPGSMGTGSYVVRGMGNDQSLCSASHGAGRRMSRGAAKRNYTVQDLERQTQGVECRKDQGVVDEIPGAYKDLETVIAAQTSSSEIPLVRVEHRLRTLLCVKG